MLDNIQIKNENIMSFDYVGRNKFIPDVCCLLSECSCARVIEIPAWCLNINASHIKWNKLRIRTMDRFQRKPIFKFVKNYII